MIIDCHTHIETLAGEVDLDSHFENCSQADYTFVLAWPTAPSNKANSRLAGYIAKKPKMIGFATINPVTDKVDTASVASVIDSGKFHGIVLYCCQNHFHPAHSRTMRLYQAADELGLPVFFHNSPPYRKNDILDFADPFLIDEIARAFPNLKIIVGSMGLPSVEKAVHLIAKNDNVFGDLTIDPNNLWQSYNTVLAAHQADIMDKLFIGSGYPCCNIQICLEKLLGFNKMLANSNLPTVPREKIREITQRNVIDILSIKLSKESDGATS